MSTPLATVDHVKMFEGEPELASKRFDTGTEIAGGKRGEFVEERLNWEVSGAWEDRHRMRGWR
jgi:hypothetical protein